MRWNKPVEGDGWVRRTYRLKLQNLSKRDEEQLKQLFQEANDFWEHLFKKGRVRMDDYKDKEGRFKLLRSHSRLGLIHKVEKVKRKGKSPSKELSAVPYPSRVSFSLEGNKLRLAGFKKKFRVLGVRQIPEGAVTSYGELVRKPSGYYFHVTVYERKREKSPTEKFALIGVDFGIRSQLTLSDGRKLRWCVRETDRLKRVQKAYQATGKRKYLVALRKEHEYVTNKRTDALNKALAALKEASIVVLQRDPISEWSKQFGSAVHCSAIGKLRQKLKRNGEVTVIEVARTEPTTKTCSVCGRINEVGRKEVFRCRECGTEIDRDVNAARNVLTFGLADWLSQVPLQA